MGWRRRHKGEGRGMYTVMMQRDRMGAERYRWMMAGGCVKWGAEQKGYCSQDGKRRFRQSCGETQIKILCPRAST